MTLIKCGLILSALTIVSMAHAQEPQVVPGEYLVKFRQSAAAPGVAQQKLSGKVNLKASFGIFGIYHVALKPGTGQAGLDALRADSEVEYIEPNYILSKTEMEDSVQANSLEALVQSGEVSAQAASYSQSAAPTSVAAAWALQTNSNSKIIVAVIDTGLDKNHHVFLPKAQGGTGALWMNQAEINGQPGVDDDGNGFIDDYNGWNFVANNNNFFDDDRNGHGTHVAGIVVGTGLNIFATPLEESKILIMPLKFLGSGGTGSTANAIKAIYYAVYNGARVINNSWGGPSYSRSLHEALSFAYDYRVLIASASGNYSDDNDAEPMYPANYDVPSNISVASTSASDRLSSFSNYGTTTVHIGSPGEWIESTVPGTNSYARMSGTSMATPFVAGLAALAIREAPSLSGYQIKQLIMGSVDDSNYLHGYVSTGGRINALKLTQSAQDPSNAASSSQPSYKPSYLAERGVAGEASGAAGGCGLISAAVKGGPGQGGMPSAGGVIAGLLLLPLIVWRALRSRDPKQRRRFDRFKMSSEVRVMVGDRELIGNMNSISEGGLSFDAEEALEKGGIVTMQIQSPDGKEVVQVQGHVVWNERNQSYGVQFDNAREGVVAMIRDWTAGLVKN